MKKGASATEKAPGGPFEFAATESVGMDPLRQLVTLIKEQGTAQGHFLGFLHILIGRQITLPDGTLVSSGLTWRDAAALLKRVRWDKQSVRELGLDPSALPPRDRERYWYSAIAQARVDSPQAVQAAQRLIPLLEQSGYQIGPVPGAGSN